MPAGTTRVQFELMMQSLPAERFPLHVHRETRSFPGYELVVAKDGPKLKESVQDLDPVVPNTPQMPKKGPDGTFILAPTTNADFTRARNSSGAVAGARDH
jgi:uncharacterized protein (TIGR03435 family)